jgi:hypothetical protein
MPVVIVQKIRLLTGKLPMGSNFVLEFTVSATKVTAFPKKPNF